MIRSIRVHLSHLSVSLVYCMFILNKGAIIEIRCATNKHTPQNMVIADSTCTWACLPFINYLWFHRFECWFMKSRKDYVRLLISINFALQNFLTMTYPGYKTRFKLFFNRISSKISLILRYLKYRIILRYLKY